MITPTTQNTSTNRKRKALFGLRVLLCAMSVVSLSACGKKGPLYIPSEAQRAQMEKDQAERDAVLKAREEKARQQDETKNEAKTSSSENTPAPNESEPQQ